MNHLHAYASLALGALLKREPVVLTHEPGWQRPEGWPLPGVKGELGPDGSRTNQYRPIAILEYVDYALTKETKEEPLW